MSNINFQVPEGMLIRLAQCAYTILQLGQLVVIFPVVNTPTAFHTEVSAPTPISSQIGIEGILKYKHEGCFQLAQELLTLCPHHQEEDAVLSP